MNHHYLSGFNSYQQKENKDLKKPEEDQASLFSGVTLGTLNKKVDFHFLFVNRMSMNTSKQVSVEQDMESFGHLPRSEVAGS